ncbi:MAG: tetratricopeptide repeat protein [Syntrophobacteraceae bacterium]
MASTATDAHAGGVKGSGPREGRGTHALRNPEGRESAWIPGGAAPEAEVFEDTLAAKFREGLERMESGRTQEAEKLFRFILAVCPTHSGSLHLLGVIAFQSGRLEEAFEYIGKAIELEPREAPYHNNLGNVLRAMGRLEEALERFRTAMALRPDSPEIDSNFGITLMNLGRPGEAEACFRTALHLRPDLPLFHLNLGNVLSDLGRFPEAEECYRKALALDPRHAEAHFGLGNVLMALCRPAEAEACYRAALLAKPDFPEACNNLGNAFQELNFLQAAELCYKDALRMRPDYAEAHYNLGCALTPQNRLDEAAECFENALASRPGYGAARLALCMAHLPVLYTDEREVFQRRSAYRTSLARLYEEGPGSCEGLAEGVGASQPFFLAYQGYNDRELQGLYGSLVCGAMARGYSPARPASPPAAYEKVRVGIVSGFFCRHTVWKLLIEGWLRRLDRGRFEVFGYHTGTGKDEETSAAESLCDRFVQGPMSGQRWREIVAADAPHVLLYPEIGMDPHAAGLAAQRLAPVQCVSWGHPVTSGFPTLDYFLSSELMEPIDGQNHYTERLIRLPNLGTCYRPDPPRPVRMERMELGLRPSATVYWSGQTLCKYLPRYDLVFPRIAQRIRNSQFVFIEYAKSRRVTEQFRARMEDAFSLLGLDASEHCVILPYLERDRFIAAVGLCDVILDTIGWSGGKSTLDCLTHNLPVVTLPGPLMRSRHTAAILRRLDVTDGITDSIDGYIRAAVRLGLDPQRRKMIAKRIAKNRSRLYEDGDYIAALEKFLDGAARRPRLKGGV